MVNEKIAKFKTQFLEQSGRTTLLNGRDERLNRPKGIKVYQPDDEVKTFKAKKDPSPKVSI